MTCAAGMAVRVIFGKNNYLRRAPVLVVTFSDGAKGIGNSQKKRKKPCFCEKIPLFS